MYGDFGASNFSEIKAFEDGAKIPITPGERTGVHNTCPHFVGRLSLKLCLPHLSLNLQVGTGFQLPVLGLI